MKKILLTIIVILVLGSCRSSFNMPNDTYKRRGDQGKWYEQQPFKARPVMKTTHSPRWANN